MRKLYRRPFPRHDWIVEDEWVRLIPCPYDWEVDGE